jgi:hypothetical protein
MASGTPESATPASPAPVASAFTAPTPVPMALVPVPSFDDNPVAAALQPFLAVLGGAFSQAPVALALDQVIPGFKASASSTGELYFAFSLPTIEFAIGTSGPSHMVDVVPLLCRQI